MAVILLSGFVGNTNMTFPNSMYLWLLPMVGLTAVSEQQELPLAS
jgi:hypothetical protein